MPLSHMQSAFLCYVKVSKLAAARSKISCTCKAVHIPAQIANDQTHCADLVLVRRTAFSEVLKTVGPDGSYLPDALQSCTSKISLSKISPMLEAGLSLLKGADLW